MTREQLIQIIADVLMDQHDIPPDRVPGSRATTSNPATARTAAEKIVTALDELIPDGISLATIIKILRS